MASRLHRRDFLRVTAIVAAAPIAFTPACGSDDDSKPASEDPADQKKVFPQGVASGDPKPDSIILWTRAVSEDGDDVDVKYELATDADFTKLVASGDVKAKAHADNTLRVLVNGLTAYTKYYYRFTAKNVRSVVGQTKTAPKDTQDVAVRFAFASCQDFVGRYYHAWKALTEEDPVDFVVFLGDYIYETDGDPSFQTPNDERKVELPDGLQISDTTKAAQTLEDYRYLYKTFRSDANLQRAHQLFPFVIIWDDHEFGNDCWQDHTTHFSGKEGLEEVPEQREAADRAWFEYQPAGVEYDENASYPDDIKIYRTLRYGKHMELFLTDQRYYRDFNVIPPGPLDARVAKIIENSSVGSRIFLLKRGFDPLEADAKPTMLGATQKAWFTSAVKGSDATWKVWGSETQLSQMVADLSSFDIPLGLNDKFYLTVDQWDGFRTERAAILSELSDVENLVAVTGDIHAFYASELHVDFDKPSDKPAAVEYVVAGITSQAIAPAAESVLSDPTFASFGLLELIPRFDELLKVGSPHYKYSNSFKNGIAVVDLSEAKFQTTFYVVDEVTSTDTPKITQVKLQTLAGTNKVEVVSDPEA